VEGLGDTGRDLFGIGIGRTDRGKNGDQAGDGADQAEERGGADKDFEVNEAAFQTGHLGPGGGFQHLDVFATGKRGVLNAAVDEAGEGGVVADTEASEGFGIAPGAEGADGVDNFLGSDPLTPEPKKNHGGEETA